MWKRIRNTASRAITNAVKSFLCWSYSLTAAVCGAINRAARRLFCQLRTFQASTTGDLATNYIGGIIIGVVIIGLAIVAIRAFFPNFFTSMFQSMQSKLNELW